MVYYRRAISQAASFLVLPTAPTSRLWSAPRLRGRLPAVGKIYHALRRTGCPRIRPRGVLECWSNGVMECCAKSEKHPDSGSEMLRAKFQMVSN